MIAPGTTAAAPLVNDTADAVASPYRTLFHRLRAVSSKGSPPGVVGVTSCTRREGVSTVAVNLAIAAADHFSEPPVLLVDANVRQPSIHKLLDMPSTPVLGDDLAENQPWQDAVRASRIRGLDFVAIGNHAGIESRFSDAVVTMEYWIEAWRNAYSMVVIDLPAIGEGALDLPMTRCLDGVLLVVEAERVPWQVACRAKELLDQSQVRLLGAVLNKRTGHIPEWLYRRL